MGRPGDSPASLRPLGVIAHAERRLLLVVGAAVATGVAGFLPLLALGDAVPAAAVTASGQVAAGAAAVAALARPLLIARERWAWGLIGTSVALLAAGDALWRVLGEPSVSAADGVSLAGLAVMHVGLVLLMRGRVARTGVMLADALAAVLAVTAVGVAALVPPLVAGGGGGRETAVDLARPMWGLALVATILGAAALTGWRPGRDAQVLLAGTGILLLADVAPLTGVVHGVPESLGDGLWPVGLAVVGAAGWCRGPRRRSGRGSWQAVVLPAVLGTVAAVLLLGAGMRPVHPLAVVVAAAAVLAVLARGTLLRVEGWGLERTLAAAERAAARDPLTGLLTHRAFRERVAEAVARAGTLREPVSLVLLDIDHFAAVNDAHGHLAGDALLRAVADRLREVARTEDVLARIGGEEFAWVLPGADDLAAWDAAERARHAIAAIDLPGIGRITASGGVADMRHAHDAAELVKLADGALYWAKAQGRDVVFRYSTEVVRALSADERARQLMRGQALNAMRVLARAVDARDRYTAQHSERVAELCVRLATALGWDHPRIVALQEAALVHDVGKIGVPDAILLKASALTEEERLRVEGHAALGAQIVADVLSVEQGAWVRAHHERYDGAGYPDMLAGEDIPQGARILTVADAWDAMTTDRPYRLGLPVGDALGRLVAGGGTHFCPRVVEAMVVLHEHGLLEPAGAVA
ncbi:MAG: diguanylate cyclase [Thermoleophilia bacterium]|nr:diguanylate cyclase [Thermoleophilia bacterium]